MKKCLWLICAILLISACGGGGGGAPGSSIKLELEWPPALAELDPAAFKLYGSLTNGETIVVSEVVGEAKEGFYLFNFDNVKDGEVKFAVDFAYAWSGAEFDVARAEKLIQLVSPETAVKFTEADFTDIGGSDPDSDLLNNLNELRLGSDPLMSDTDGDGVSDGLDAFPSLSTEWQDTDGDGIGDNTDDDIDGDGLDNDTELGLGTDVYKFDTDDDGVGDRDDNCKLGANVEQTDTDGDGFGDACDGDSDGDGLSDEEEKALGTNPLLADTDGDGLADKTEVDGGLNPLAVDSDGDSYNDKEDLFPLDPNDWQDSDGDGTGDNADNCPSTTNADQKNTDEELAFEGYPVAADNLGDACDDDIDGDGLNVVFVDATRGSDDSPGTFNAPVTSLKQGIVVAYARNEDIYVAGGEYDVSEAVFKNGVNLSGGFDGATFDSLMNDRDIRSSAGQFATYLKDSNSSVTINLSDSQGTFFIEGFHIINETDAESSSVVALTNSSVILRGNTILGNSQASFSKGVYISGGSPELNANWIEGGAENGTEGKGIVVESANPLIKNNVVKGGEARHVAAIEISDSAALIVNNTLDGTSYANVPATSSGLVFHDSEPTVVNNVIVAGPGGDSGDAVAMKCFGSSPDSAEFRNNIFSTFTSGTSDALVVDCDGQFHYDADFTLGGSTVDGNIAFDGEFSELLNSGYGLVGSVGTNKGIDTSPAQYGNVIKDFSLQDRTGSYDIGAKEK